MVVAIIFTEERSSCILLWECVNLKRFRDMSISNLLQLALTNTASFFVFFFSTGVTHVMIYIFRIHTQITFVNLYSNLKYKMQKVLKWLCVHEITKIIYL